MNFFRKLKNILHLSRKHDELKPTLLREDLASAGLRVKEGIGFGHDFWWINLTGPQQPVKAIAQLRKADTTDRCCMDCDKSTHYELRYFENLQPITYLDKDMIVKYFGSFNDALDFAKKEFPLLAEKRGSWRY